MLIKIAKSWDIPESALTPESVFFNRRAFLGGGAAAVATAAAIPAFAQRVGDDPSARLYPFKRNDRYQLDREITPESINTTYNNFYEFGSHKQIHKAAQALPIRPWTVTIDGMVEKAMTVDIDELLAKMPLEERHYRHRCVEAWSMAVAWSGFAFKDFVAFCKPLASAKYVAMDTFLRPEIASGQKASWYPWPYREGLSIEEATNELAFLATGAYGKPLAKQMGAPLRLAVPWKYGFKAVKSIVRFEFTDKRPVSFWEKLQPQEYGFWANVNPQVAHPRWSQATEEVLGANKRVPTQLYNGYAEQVSHLYKDMTGERLFL
jgi:sulfoxide reductase catalytic subunit YedY